MKKLRNALAFVLAVMLVFTAVPITALAETTASVADFSDFPTGWSRAAMTDAVENGLIQGYEDLTVRPTDLLTRAQMAAIINRAFGAEVKASIDGNFSDVSQTDWFYEDVQKAVQMKTFNGYDGFFRPNEPITREDAIVVIARALVISMEDTSFLHNFGDKDSVADYAEGAFAAFLERGYIRGYEDTTLRPKNNITREEFAQIMYNIFAEYERASGSVSLGDCEGEVVLTGDNVHLYSTNIAGDLIIGDGVGNTNVTLENVNVAGRILFRGGEGIVNLRNVTKNGLIVVNDVNGTVNFNHYSTESIFTNAVYNTPATFIDKTVSGGSASGTGLGTHDTTVVGRNDAKTGDSGKKDPTLPPVNQGTGGGTVVRYTVTVDPDNGEAPTVYTIRRNYSLSSYDYTLPTVTKAGFRFDGWYYMDGTTETEFNERTIIRTATNVYAKWVEQVTVTMPDESVKTYDKGDKTLGDIRPLLPSDPVKDGFRFDGWQYDDGTGVKDYDDSIVIDKNITISAKWVEQVTVTFDVDGTLTVKTIDINTSLDAAEFPADPVKPGYTFVRWVYDLAGTATEFTSSVIVTSSIVVTPEWADDMATVIFMNEGTEHARLSVRVGETVTALPADPTKEHSDFLGWFYTESGIEKQFTTATTVTGDMTVNAKWSGAKYTVTYNSDGAFYAEKTDIDAGSTVGTLPEAPSKAGYRFIGWFYDVSGIKTEFTASTQIYSDITVTAEFVEQVTVTFDVDGTLTVKTIDINTSLDAAEFPADPVKPGYTFVRWVYDLAGTATEFTSSVIVTGSIVVTPEWADDMATVIFMNEGTEHARLSVRVGETVTALPADPTKEHADFLGWFYTESGIEKQFTTATTVTGDMTVNAKWSGVTYTVTYLNEDGTEFDKTTGITPGSPAGTPANGTPVKTGWKFVGWFYDVSGTETELTAETLVYTDITATAKFEQTFTVNFCEYLDPENIKHTVSGIISGSTVDVSEIETANGNLDERFLYGYEANTSNISATYDKNVKHEIYGAWYYLDGGKYVPFNETVVIDRDIDAFYLFKAMNATVHLDSILGQIGSIALSVNYDEESSVQQTVLDLLWNSTNTTNIKTAANFALDKLLGKNFVISDKIEYMPIDADGEIMNAYYDYRLIDLLGESTIRQYVRDSIYDMVKNDSEILKAAIKQMLSSLGSDADLLDKCDGYITADPELVNQLKQFINDELATNQELRDELEARALVRFETEWANDTDAFIIAAIRESYPDYDLLPPEQQAALLASVKADPVKVEQIKTAAWLEALDYAMANAADEILADSELRKEAIVRASENETIVNNLTEKIYEKIESEISNPSEENKEFIEEIIDTATAYYDAQIEEFINSLKNEDSYLINYDAVNNIDRRFIISAVRSKLASTTYEEIQEKLPSFVLKVLDEAVLRDIFDTVLNNYKAEVEAVYNAVYPVYDGNDHYVSSSVEIVVNPIEQVLIPYYNKAMAKLDPAIKGSQYYEANPYIKEIEALMHYNQLITKTDKTAPYAGYAIKSVDDYYSLVYKTSVLVYDAGSWFVENVPEDELDNVIKLAAERIGGYYDKLLDKFSALQGDKADKVKNTFENLVAKLLARNNAEIWNNSTDLVLSTKLDELYAKACQVVLDRSGFDITNDIEIEIAADCQSITLSQNGRTITKTLADIAYDIQAGGADVSIDGSVITINGRQIDLAVYLKKIADKIGYNFTVSLIIDNSAVESNNQNLKAYKLNINSDYISVVIQLQ